MTLFFQQWSGELLKLFARRRTYIGFGAFVALQILVFLLIKKFGLPTQRLIAGSGENVSYYLSALTLASFVMGVSVFLLGALFLSLVAGDIVAKEGEDGHMRLLLARPVSRFRLLLLKYLTCTGYAVFMIQFLAWTAFVLGLALYGWGGGFFALVPEVSVVAFYDWGPGLQRYALSSLYLGLSMTTISSIAFFLSCFRIKPAAATIGALTYILVDFIMRTSGFMDNYQHLLITKHMASWGRILAETIDWPLIWRGYAVVLAVNISLFTLGYAVFESRDLKS
ncbi:ABC transporter permease [Prosthecobacter sp.]|uniref:ABC transporter permease n=1 Tax=Prosthecobacter sp. TaxID=1965333 RepID=UPI002AB9FFF4|nr:ABC transporter permease [Prosthecobacter sp.]MDZ4401940.1 ABC transporter permease [Prosthecobacter sp.]